MYPPKHPPNNSISPDAFRAALASGELLTAHQAADLVGIPYSTFNYHLCHGHIDAMPSLDSRTRFVTRTEAFRFARQLQDWRERRSFYPLDEDEAPQDETTDETDEADARTLASA